MKIAKEIEFELHELDQLEDRYMVHLESRRYF